MRMRCALRGAIAIVALGMPAKAAADYPHVVAPGESLSSIAAADGLSVGQLAAANGLPLDAQLIAARTLMIPPQGTSSPASAAGAVTQAPFTAAATVSPVAAAPSPGGAYVVEPGDTLSAIATRAGTTVQALAAANGLDANGLLRSGRVLRLSGSGSGSSAPLSVASTSTSADQQPVGPAAEGDPAAPPYPTPERLSAGEVGQIGSDNGAGSSLTDAIAWQESGFNNALVSSADARGIMQILPGTWSWIQHSLATAAPLAPASATDNVRGGALMLRWLLNETGGDPALAAAAYYQGLSSVRRYGMFSDTQRYVQSVMALRSHFGG